MTSVLLIWVMYGRINQPNVFPAKTSSVLLVLCKLLIKVLKAIL